MADYIATCRSNYVRIKEGKEAEFLDLCSLIGMDVDMDEREEGVKRYKIKNEEGGLNGYYTTEDKDGDEIEHYIDWGKDFGSLLADGEILLITESGYEKMRYLCGFGTFIRSDGKVKCVDIHEGGAFVKGFLKKHDTTMTECSY